MDRRREHALAALFDLLPVSERNGLRFGQSCRALVRALEHRHARR